MRTTLDIADDVLAAARDLARRQGKPVGQVISELARRGLAGHENRDESSDFFGFRTLPKHGKTVTNELINEIRDEIGEPFAT